jgi:hypothetical protein
MLCIGRLKTFLLGKSLRFFTATNELQPIVACRYLNPMPPDFKGMTKRSTVRVETRQRSAGGWTFELFIDDSSVWAEGDLRTFATQQEAERASRAYLALGETSIISQHDDRREREDRTSP